MDHAPTSPSTQPSPDLLDGSEPVDLVVVGAGLAGLCAAATAARSGLRVVVSESRNPGGRAAVTRVDPGVVFNSGPRAFYTGGPGEAALAALGIAVRGGAPDANHSYGARAGRVHRLPAGPLTLARTSLLSARSKLTVGRLLATLGRVDTSGLGSVSVRQWMADAGLRDDAVDLVRTVLRTATYADDVDHFSADAAIAQMQLALGPGVRYPDGGFAQIVDALRDAAVAAGARIIDHDPVRAVESTQDESTQAESTHGEPTRAESTSRESTSRESTGAGRAVPWTVRTATRSIAARTVLIATGSPDSVARLVPVELDRSGIGEPVTAACLELAVRRPPDQPLLLGVDAPLYLTRHTPAAAGLAPEGITVVHVIRYGARSSDEDQRDLWAHAALAGLGPDDVVAQRFLHRMVVAGGLPLAERGGLSGRPPVQVPGAQGLLIAGDWVGDQGLLGDAALASGRRAAELATDRVERIDPARLGARRAVAGAR